MTTESAVLTGHGPSAIPALTGWRKVALASGDLGMNLYWQSITYFLLFFYTDILGISAGWAGLIYMAASIFDGIIDPVVGHVIDNNNTRWGRYRPWIAIGAVPLALSFMLIYWSPSFSGTMLIVFVTAAHLLFRVCYTIVAVPIASLTASVLRDSRERSSLTGMRIMFALAGAVLVASASRPLGGLLSEDEAMGFFWVAGVSGCIATIIYFIVVLSVREPPASSEAGTHAKMPLKNRFVAVRRNRAFVILAAALLGATLAITAVSKSVIYYFKYVVLDEAMSSTALGIITVSSFLSVPVWTMVGRRYGKRQLWLIGASIAVVTLMAMGLLQPRNPALVIALYVFLQISIAAISVAYWAMLPDTVEYGEWETGIRLESFLVGLFMFTQKLGLGLAAGLFGLALDLIGLSHSEPVSASFSAALPLVVVAFAMTGFLASGLLIYFSPLKNGVHERITAELMKR